MTLTLLNPETKIPSISFYRRCGMKGGYYFPKGRKTGRVWYWFEKRKHWVQHSVYGERLFDKSQCEEVLNAIANEIKNNRHHPEEWGKGNILKFERAWEIFDEQNTAFKSESTQDYRRQIYRDHLFPYFEKFSLRQIEEEDNKDFFSKLPKDYSPYSLLKIMGVLRTFLNFHRVTWVKRLRYPKISLPQKSIPRLNQEDQFRVLEFVEDRHKSIIVFCLAYGCRVSEACNLRKQDINWQDRAFTFRERKNKKDHELPILPHIEGILKERRPVEHFEYVFCTKWGRKYRRQMVTLVWRLANRKAHDRYGVPIVTFKNATRHSLVCQMVNEGKTFEEIGSITGNSPRVLERHYGSMNVKRKLEILTGKVEILREAR